eukprot:TRINITY_DN9318_c0_g1_i2.p1 TRINITY_DN9318_c0_g1~~TRINITY_DN9318_c0_g1_i2.p1  ORF type:complete len:827 (-),score=349.73 TRINITY_DN9318_c0_g1_i2:54-2534(-)
MSKAQKNKNNVDKKTNDHKTDQERQADRNLERMLFIALSFIGQRVEVQTRDQQIWEGHFHTVGLSSPHNYNELLVDFGSGADPAALLAAAKSRAQQPIGALAVVLSWARKKSDVLARPTARVLLSGEEVVQIVAREVDVVGADSGLHALYHEGQGGLFVRDDVRSEGVELRGDEYDYNDEYNDEFTDVGISKRRNLHEKQFVPFKLDPPIASQSSLEFDETAHATGSWDQFEVNQRKFGVKSTFREEIYTSVINKSDPSYKKLEHEAQRIAAEILADQSDNIHIAEERGQVNFEHLDEEERYSSVLRPNEVKIKLEPAANNSNNNGAAPKTRYVVPARRGTDAPLRVTGASASVLTRSADKISNNNMVSGTVPAESKEAEDIIGRVQTRSNSQPSLLKRVRGNRTASLSVYMSPPVTPQDRTVLVTEFKRLKQQLAGHTSPKLNARTSPLISDPKAVSALNLQPASPKMSEKALQDFVNFSLKEKGKTERREQTLQEFKKFSTELAQKKSFQTRVKPSEDKKSAAPAPTPTPAPARPKLKLNPNAQEFKPLAATLLGSSQSVPQPPVSTFFPASRKAPYIDTRQSISEVYCRAMKQRTSTGGKKVARDVVPQWEGSRYRESYRVPAQNSSASNAMAPGMEYMAVEGNYMMGMDYGYDEYAFMNEYGYEGQWMPPQPMMMPPNVIPHPDFMPPMQPMPYMSQAPTSPSMMPKTPDLDSLPPTLPYPGYVPPQYTADPKLAPKPQAQPVPGAAPYPGNYPQPGTYPAQQQRPVYYWMPPQGAGNVPPQYWPGQQMPQPGGTQPRAPYPSQQQMGRGYVPGPGAPKQAK